MDARLLKSLPYLLVGAAAAYLYYVAAHIEFHRRGDNLGPDFWPKAILVLIIATCLYEVVRIALFSGRRDTYGVLQDIVQESVDEHSDDEAAELPPPRRPRILIAGVAVTALYAWIIQTLGFFLATVLYLAIFIWLGGYRRWAVNAAVSLIGTLAMMFFFMKVVYVSLPLGHEPFEQITFFLMRVMGIR